MLVMWFENEKVKDINLIVHLETLAQEVKGRVKEKGELILELTCSLEAFESVKAMHINDYGYDDIVWLLEDVIEDSHMRLVENIKEWNVFPWGEYIWRHLYDQIVNVEFKVNVDLTAIISELKSDWYIAFWGLFMVYIPRNALIKCNNLYEDYFKKLSIAHKQAKIATTDLPMVPRCASSYLLKEIKLKDNVITQLNTRVFKLKAIIQVFGQEINDVSLENLDFRQYFLNIDNDFDDDVIKDYLIEEEIRLRAEQEESWRLQEQKVMEEVFVKRLKEEASTSRIRNSKRSQRSSDFSSYYWGSSYAMGVKDKDYNNLSDQDMKQFLKDVKPWAEGRSQVRTM
nr:hypothetical protein [Tanacetum cinerariifolium]